MEGKKLHIALRQAIEQFGTDVLKESRLVNILLDYGAYTDVPASKTIIQAIVTGGYGQRILDLGKQKRSFFSSLLNSESIISKPEGEEWHNKIDSFSATISKQNGFQQPLVDYVLNCIVFGLNWNDTIPEVPSQTTPSSFTQKPTGPQPKKVNNGISSGQNTNKTNSVSYHQILDEQFLVMKVSPKNATVFVDGKQQFVSNGIMAVELPVGTHSYEVKADFYETKTGTVDISSSSKAEIDVVLKLEQKNVKLIVDAADSDADIFINGISYGKGRWEGLVEEGDYVIEGKKHRYYSYEQTVSVHGTDKLIVHVPSLIAICGSLKVNVQPYGSKIIVNGEDKGVTPLLVNNIVIGERKLTVQSAEGTEYTTIVEVRENQVTDVNHIIPSLFLFDYSEVRLGDYYYEDGSFSHEIALGKEMVGMVFNLNTSEEEKKNGWTHGQIIALHDVKSYNNNANSWGIPTKEVLQQAVRNPGGITNSKDNGYLMNHLDSVLNNPEFKPFLLAAQYDGKLPNGKTSGWYLPCISQWRTLYYNFHKEWKKYWHFLKITGRGGLQVYATSSIFDSHQAWKYGMGYAEEYIDRAYQKESFNADWSMLRAVESF